VEHTELDRGGEQAAQPGMYRIREIAAQAGLSQATVDRVLHNRGGVRASTVREVHAAIADLDRQRAQVRLGGRAFVIDVVVQAPRFSAAVTAALEAESPALRPAVIRPRFHLFDGPADLVAVLRKVGRSRSQGLILKAPDTPEIVDAVGRLAVPVVTLVTDLPASKRVAHVGIADADAGATAAYLVEQWLADRAGDVLVVRGRGEDAREGGFRAEMRGRAPNRRLLEVVDEEDRAAAVHARTRDVLAANPSVRAVYSLHAGAGGNAAVVDAFASAGRKYDVFVAHDLDDENTALLRSHRLSAVLHHDLRADLRRACLAVMRAQGALPGPVRSNPSAIHVITPFNTPPVEF
jgi:LacI family transcriptional regulator